MSVCPLSVFQTVCLLIVLSQRLAPVPGLAPVSKECEGGPEALAWLLLWPLSILVLSVALTGHLQHLSMKESPTYAVCARWRSCVDLAGQRRRRPRQIQSGSSACWERMMGNFQD